MRKLIPVVFLLSVFFSCKKDTGRDLSKAQYKVIFTFYWSAQNFSTAYPSNAHFSPLIGWSHQANNTFFAIDSLATLGVKIMAETGRTTPLDNELNAKIAEGQGYQMYIGNSLATGTGKIEMDVEVTYNFPEVSLVSMVAPSPDWYIGALNVNLVDGDVFVKEKRVDVLVYDAGTDSGLSFTSVNEETLPQNPITNFVSTPLGNGTVISPVFARAHFIKQ